METNLITQEAMKKAIHKDMKSEERGKVEKFLHRFWRSQVQVTQMGQYPYGRHVKPSCFEVPIGNAAKENLFPCRSFFVN